VRAATRNRQAVQSDAEASATLIFGPNPFFAQIVLALFVVLSIDRLSKLLKAAESSSEKRIRDARNDHVRECAQRRAEGAPAASGVQLAVI
jgi:hypothetical protein